MPVAKSVLRRGVNMTALGKLIWKEMCRKSGEAGQTHPLEHYADDVLPLGPKTLKRRLSDDDWLIKTVLILQADLDSDALENYLIDLIKAARPRK
jgi:hypothetical protein